MKFILFLGDGMADYPIESLGGRTPLMAAETPHIDSLAVRGRCGLFVTLPEGMPTGSAVANLSVMGYDPKLCFEGRGVLEAASQGIAIEEADLVMRCNLICMVEGRIKNHSAGHITSEEAKILIEDLDEALGSEQIRFYNGVSYRHTLILKGEEFSSSITCTPPHDVPGEEFKKVWVKGEERTRGILNDLILRSNEILENHPVNLKRADAGKDKANYIWPWSQGRNPQMKSYAELYQKSGAVISAVDLIKGIGIYAGFDIMNVSGATGIYTTNYEGKAEACIEALKRRDFVYCHVEASDEAGHENDPELKIRTIEYFDRRLIGTVLERLEEIEDEVSIAVLPDHFTPCALRTHTREPVPFLIYNPLKKGDSVLEYNEETCKGGSLGVLEGNGFIREFFSWS